MPTEAQRLISVSLTKIAHSRAQRGGVSLHKNLLVATVLQKARYIFMEEAYHMVQIHSMQPRQQYQHHPQQQQQQQQLQQQHQQQQQQHHHQLQHQQLHHQQQHQLEHEEYEEDNLVALTAEEAGIRDQAATEDSASESSEDVLPPPPCDRCADPSATTPTDDKENHLPQSDVYTPVDCPTYLDLDKDDNILRERTNSAVTCASTKCLKRRRVPEWETEEAVTSILPKRVKSCCDISSTASSDETVFLDESLQDKQGDGESSMEIDRITSLVSIFSFGGLGGDAGIGKLTRSVSTPDLCSAQANEGVDSLQQRSFLAMTV